MWKAVAFIAVAALGVDKVKELFVSTGNAVDDAGDGSLKIGGTVLALGAGYLVAKHFKVI